MNFFSLGLVSFFLDYDEFILGSTDTDVCTLQAYGDRQVDRGENCAEQRGCGGH